MMANSTSRAASQSMLAPTSRKVVMPRGVGMLVTSAGRSRSALIRRIKSEMAIRAPVLPEETAAAASPSRTASTAFHIEVPLPRRSAWAGFSSMATTMSVSRISTRARAVVAAHGVDGIHQRLGQNEAFKVLATGPAGFAGDDNQQARQCKQGLSLFK